MKTFVATVIVAALTLPAYAEGDLTGSEAIGEANGSVKLSTAQSSEIPTASSIGGLAMAQGSLQETKAPATKSKKRVAKAKASGELKASGEKARAEATDDSGASAALAKSPTGMDGGNRK